MASPSRAWNTDVVPAPQRLDYWVGAVCEAFLEMDVSRVERSEAGFDASLIHQPLGEIAVNRVDATAQRVARTPSAIARSRQNYFYLISQDAQPWRLRQQGREADLRPGDAALVDSRACYGFDFSRGVASASIQLPVDWVSRWLPRADDVTALRIPGDTGWGAALRGALQALTPAFAAAVPWPPALLTDQLGVLLALAVPQAGGLGHTPTRMRADVRLRVIECLRARLAEPGLVAQQVADDCGLSLRGVHRAFAGAASFADTLRRMRLEQGVRMLLDRRFARLSVAEVGRRCGYADPAHFGRQFRAAQGTSPAAFRRAALRGSAPGRGFAEADD